MRILGVDPGSQVTGYGLIEGGRGRPRALHFGTLRPPRGQDLADRLVYLYRGLRGVVEEHAPDLVCIETAFYRNNPHSTLVLGQVRGVLILAVREVGVALRETSPREVKLAVTGNGGASKEQVQFMVRSQLHVTAPLTFDASDALAVALSAWQRTEVA